MRVWLGGRSDFSKVIRGRPRAVADKACASITVRKGTDRKEGVMVCVCVVMLREGASGV